MLDSDIGHRDRFKRLIKAHLFSTHRSIQSIRGSTVI